MKEAQSRSDLSDIDDRASFIVSPTRLTLFIRKLTGVTIVVFLALSIGGLISAPAAAEDLLQRGSIIILGHDYDVETLPDPNMRIASFNQKLAANAVQGRITDCSVLIAIPVGIKGANVSYGGYCQLADETKTLTIEICDDDMFGHFDLKDMSGAVFSKDDMADFVAGHCFGG